MNINTSTKVFILSFVLLVFVGLSVRAQESSLREFIDDLSIINGWEFIYNNTLPSNLDLKNIDSDADKTNLRFLNNYISSTGYKIVYIEDNYYAVVPLKSDKKKRSQTLPIVREVFGKIVDTTGSPLIGVTVGVKDQNIATTTDLNGNYILEIPEGATIVYSMIGFESQSIEVGDRNKIDVVLRVGSESLDEVVVVAFGQQKKSEVVGSMTTINPAELKVPSSNLTTALAGRLSGMIAYQRSGEPGQDNAEFFIRGVTSFGYKKDPLILIDGIELTTTDLARLQPDDIESFSIMKDATATALYGARGANGVILVTTKEGKEGKAKITLRMEGSISRPTTEVELADPITYMRLHNESVLTRDPLGIMPYMQSKIDNTIAGTNPYMYPANDFRKDLIKNQAFNYRTNLSVAGGGKVARYYIAGSYNRDNGMLKVDRRNNFNNNIDLQSYLLRSNVNINLSKSTELIVRLHGSFDDYKGPIDGGEGTYRKIMRSNPVLFPSYFPVTNETSYVQHILFGNSSNDNQFYINPYADLVKGYKDYSRSLMLAQFEVKQDLSFLTKGLTFRALGNTNRTSYFDVSRSYNPFYYQAGFYDPHTNTYKLSLLNESGSDKGTEYLGYSEGEKLISSVFYMESALNYTKTIADKHNLSGMLVYVMRQQLNANAGDLQQSLPFRNLGLSGRTTYSYNDKYFAEFNFGYNGSERFYKNHRFGFFPSFGAGWTVSKEPFWKDFENTVSFLKIRGTYGLVGNDAIGSANDRFFYLSNVNMDDAGKGFTFGSDFRNVLEGVSISRYSNTSITWETAIKSNLGIEFGLFDKINVIAEFYKEDRDNILMTRASVPTTMGLQAPIRANVGKASGQGIDLSVDYQQNFNPDFWITARANFTYATSKYKVFEEPEYDESWLSKVGYSLSQQWGYVAERLFVDDKEVGNSPEQGFGESAGGDLKYRDINGDGKVTTLDRVPIGFPTMPEIVYGFGFSVGYKDFDFSAFFQGLGRESFWIDPEATAPFINYRYPSEKENDRLTDVTLQNQLLKAYADNYWSESNPDIYAIWPRLSSTLNENNSQRSTWFMRNGAFLRLKMIELGYNLTGSMAKKVGMENLRFYVSGTNLLTFSKFNMWDVEMGGNGLGYPIQKVFNFGIRASF